MSPKTRSHWKEYGIALCATLITATAGTCYGWPSPTLPYLQSKESSIPTSQDEGSWIVSIMILCSALTPIPSAYLADRFGRKTTLLLGAIPFILGWVLVIVAKSVAVLYVARMFSGLGYGIVYTVAPMYTGEIATNEVRGALSTLITLMNKIGILAQYCIGPFVSMRTLAAINLILPISFVVKDSWGIYTAFWGFAAFSLLGLAYMLIALPETKGKSFANIQAHLRRDVARDNASKLMTVEF